VSTRKMHNVIWGLCSTSSLPVVVVASLTKLQTGQFCVRVAWLTQSITDRSIQEKNTGKNVNSTSINDHPALDHSRQWNLCKNQICRFFKFLWLTLISVL